MSDARIQFITNLLKEKGILSEAQTEQLWAQFKDNPPQSQQELETKLIEQELISEENLLKAYSQHLTIPYLDLETVTIDPQVVNTIPVKFAKRNVVIAFKKEGRALTVALRNPFEVHIVDELKMITGLAINIVLSKQRDILNAIKSYYGVGAETVEILMQDVEKDADIFDEKQQAQPEDLDAMTDDASIINYVNQILEEAYEKRATDIHIEPFENTLRIRYRIDGILRQVKTSPDIKKLQEFIISRFKIMANLNIAEKRRPQDGRAKMVLGGEDVDLRLSTFPTLFGEGISIRLLSKNLILLGIDQLGLSAEMTDELKTILKKPNGIVLVTGPTGCGKTTTLYAALNYINDAKVNIITLEDPIEYQLEGINQIQINPQVELTFANGLRSILRQDPDIVMVGEIRDLDTAQISIRAALTGHLILSTLHTNNALATITRLLDLGVDSYLVAGTIRAVVAQRLVRKLCSSCKQEYAPDASLLGTLGIPPSPGITFYKEIGCPLCEDTGFMGRTGIYELLIVDESFAELINKNATQDEMRNYAQGNGMLGLLADGIEKIKQGITTVQEVLKVTEQG